MKTLADPDGLEFYLKWLKVVILQPPKKAIALIDKTLQLTETTPEEKAILLAGKAFVNIMLKSLSEAQDYANTALIKARGTASDIAKAWALFIKGLVAEAEAEHQKAIAWHTKALSICPAFLKPGIMLALGNSFCHKGEYNLALGYIDNTIIQTGKPIENNMIAEEVRPILLFVQAEAWSLLGTVNESIGDFDEARRNYDKALELANENQFAFVKIMTLLRKMKLMLMMGNKEDAGACLKEVKKLQAKEINPRMQVYIDHDEARLEGVNEQYEKALRKCSGILFGDVEDEKNRKRHLYDLMETEAELFGEVLLDICRWLRKTEMEKKVVRSLEEAGLEYEAMLSDAGRFKELYKLERVNACRKNIEGILKRLFEEPLKTVIELRYRDLVFKYYPAEKRGYYKDKMGKRRYFGQRIYIVLNHFINNQGRWITRRELKDLIEREMRETISIDSIRGDVRKIRTNLGFGQFIETRKKEGGYKLLPERTPSNSRNISMS